MLPQILLTLFLVFLNGFFVAAEFAIVKVRASQIETSGIRSGRMSGAARKIVNQLDAYLAATQLGITLASLGLGWVGESVVSKLIISTFHALGMEIEPATAHDVALPLAFAVITVLHIVFGELAPKSLAIRFPAKTTFAVALPLRVFYFIFRPFIWLLNGLANFILRAIGIRPVPHGEIHSEEELKVIIQESAEGGAIEEFEQDIVERVFSLSDRKVSELMTHRMDLVWMDVRDDLKTVKEKVSREIHSVYPVCDGSIDNLIGVLAIQELFPLELSESTFQLREYVRDPVFLVENTLAYQALERFKQERFSYGIVVDEFGAVQGIISMDDIMNALLGEISEYNHEEYKIVQRDENSWLADAKLPFFLFLEYFELDKQAANFSNINTLAGFVLHYVGKIPELGQKFEWNNFEFEVVDMDDRRIDKLLITRTDQEEEL